MLLAKNNDEKLKRLPVRADPVSVTRLRHASCVPAVRRSVITLRDDPPRIRQSYHRSWLLNHPWAGFGHALRRTSASSNYEP